MMRKKYNRIGPPVYLVVKGGDSYSCELKAVSSVYRKNRLMSIKVAQK